MNDMVFVSAQPDSVYFHWQVELYLYQFSKHGIIDKCYAIFGYADKPSEYVLNLAKRYNIFYYKDERTDKTYIPSIRPHILKKFFADKPELSKNVFYHDSDIFLVKLPKFELMQEDAGYLSDTISYIGYNYLQSCSRRYKDKHAELPDNDLISKMCECMEISEDVLKENERNSGGAQYILKNVDSKFWTQVEVSCNKLYAMLKSYEKKYPIDHHVQSWTTDMWCVLWEYWKLGNKTIIHDELDFSWGVSDVNTYNSKNIFHLAGVVSKDSRKMFYKGEYNNKSPIEAYRADKSVFDYIPNTSATYEYINVLKEFTTKTTLKIPDGHWAGIYSLDGRLWRSADNNYILFWNSSSWIVTSSKYELTISPSSGGYASYAELNQFIY